MDNDAIKNWPHWLRWGLSYPAAVLGAFVGAWLFRILSSLFGPQDQQWWYDIVQTGMIGYFFVFISCWFAPKSRRVVSIVSLGIVIALSFFLVGIIFLASSYGRNLDDPLIFYVSLVVFIGAAVGAVMTVHQLEGESEHE